MMVSTRRHGLRAFLIGLDSRAKLLGVFAAIVVVTSWRVDSPALLLSAALLPVLLSIAAGGTARGLAGRGLVLVGLLAMAMLGWWLFRVPEAAGVGARAINLILAGIFGIASGYLLLLTTSAQCLRDGLLRLRVPVEVAWTLALGLRYLPLLREDAIRLYRAAAARGAGRRPKLRVLGWLASALVVRAFERSQKTSRAMTARAFGHRPVRPPRRPLSAGDWLFLMGYPALTALVLAFP